MFNFDSICDIFVGGIFFYNFTQFKIDLFKTHEKTRDFFFMKNSNIGCPLAVI